MVPVFIRLWVGEENSGCALWPQLISLVPLFTSLGVANSAARELGYMSRPNIIFSILKSLKDCKYCLVP